MQNKLDLVCFAKTIAELGSSIVDGFDIEELAVKHGILYETKFDPNIHVDEYDILEPGDPWFEYTDEFKKLLP